MTLKSINEDGSSEKLSSLSKFQVLVMQNKAIFEGRIYKAETEVLFKAYGLRYVTSANKKELSKVLVPAVIQADTFSKLDAFF